MTWVSGVSAADVKPIDSPIRSAVMLAHLADAQEPETIGQRATHEDVAPERQLVGQRTFLEHRLDAQCLERPGR